MKYGFIGPVVSEEKMFENVDNGRRTDDGRTTDAWLYYKLTYEPKGSGELTTEIPKMMNALIQFIGIEESTRHKWVNSYLTNSAVRGFSLTL